MGSVEGKVVVVSGAARGQGRAHAIRFAEEGADVVAFDICRGCETVPYELAGPADLEETVRAVEGLGRRGSSASGGSTSRSRTRGSVRSIRPRSSTGKAGRR